MNTPTSQITSEVEVKCMGCGGSGKPTYSRDFSGMNIFYKPGTYRGCDVCAGTGRVPPERRYYTHNPSLSLQIALKLLQLHGNPLEIYVAMNIEEVWVTFQDGQRFVLGGLGCGYVGERTGNFCAFLSQAGFSYSHQYLSTINSPAILKPGALPKRIIWLWESGTTIEEARQKAYEEAHSKSINITEEKIVSPGGSGSVVVFALSANKAETIARKRVPESAKLSLEARRLWWFTYRWCQLPVVGLKYMVQYPSPSR